MTCREMFAPPEPVEKPENAKSPAERGFSECAEEDSNLHPVIPDQALNLARLPIPPLRLKPVESTPVSCSRGRSARRC